MRLIDADALMADLEKWLKQIDPTHPPEDNAIPPMEDIIVSTLMTIEEQPTIEPQRMRGKWINEGIYGEGHSMCSIRCSNPLCNFHFIGYLDDYNYCPNCGSYNGGEE